MFGMRDGTYLNLSADEKVRVNNHDCKEQSTTLLLIMRAQHAKRIEDVVEGLTSGAQAP
jgi:hypothetical protein